jgi:PAS domain S-box-containing protein
MLQVTLMGVVPLAHVLQSLQVSLARSRRSEQILTADLIDRLRTEDKLREALQQLQLITENMAAGVTRCGRDLRYIWVSRSFAASVGCTQEDVTGRPILDVIGRDAYETILPHIGNVLSGKKEEYEAQVNYRGIGQRWIRAVYEPTRDAGGHVDGWIAVVTDITDARRAQEEEFARQKLESLGTLAGGIAHDFNNLLGGVLAQAELALEEYQVGASPEEELKRIRDGAIRGSEIVRQLMIYAGKESEAVGLVDVSQVAMGMIELLRVSISKHASVVTDFGPDLPAVRGSAGQIQQIVMNLVTNACEALEDRDGVIRVATRRVNLDWAAAVSKGIAEGEYVLLEVTDTGRGMSLEVQARVFDPFFTTKSEGHGLGLAMVRGIVRGLGGAIHLESEPGKGTTFQIFLRSTGIMTGVSGPLPTARESNPGPLATILVVEDDDALRVALAQILRRRGFETLDAANGADAINLLRANSIKIDMMLLDMTIPGPSSHDVASVAAEARPGLKVVLTSAYDEKTVRSRVGASQNCGFIRKPFQVEELVQTLRNGLSLGTAAG